MPTAKLRLSNMSISLSLLYSAIDTRVYGGKRYDYWKANVTAMNAAFHNVKWEEEMETKGVNVRWKYFKLKIEE